MNSKFAQHLWENGHAFGKVDDIREIRHFSKNGTYMDTIGKVSYTETPEGETNKMINLLSPQ